MAYAFSTFTFTYGATSNDDFVSHVQTLVDNKVTNAQGDVGQLVKMEVKAGAGGYV